ncbi:MAG: TolC family protein, partial [Gammaproteobacteria bacterium]|nr:TolC family protein [Gammaproteobacteria bacterium]
MWTKAIGPWLLASLAGCTVGPDYRAPEALAHDRWKAAETAAGKLKPISEEALKTWWKTFKDPKLDRLMAKALAGNLDLQIAFGRIEQARAERRANRADLFPRVAGNAAAA